MIIRCRQTAKHLAYQRRCLNLNAFIKNENNGATTDPAHQLQEDQFGIRNRHVSIKDNICTLEQGTTCASTILEGHQSPMRATVISKLKEAGALVVAKTNMDEFGMGSDSVNSIHGPVQNLYSRDGDRLSAGGSSGGSAVSVLAKDCNISLGTDTGGSIRLPAAYTGLVGFKPSYGMVSRWGIVAYANSLDTVGILGHNAIEVRNVFNAIKGHDHRDPTSLKPSSRNRIQSLRSHGGSTEGRENSRSHLRIGVPTEYNTEELQPVVRQAWIDTLKRLQADGHTLQPISLPATKLALSAYYVLAPAEASSNLAKFDGIRYGHPATSRSAEMQDVLYAATRGAGFGKEVKRRILLGSYSLSAAAMNNHFIQAQRIRRLVQQDFNRVFSFPNPLIKQSLQGAANPKEGVDVIITPTAQSLPPKLKDLAQRDITVSYSADVLTVPASLAGLPAISMPVHIHNDDAYDTQSVGIQIIAQYGDDDNIFNAARVIEQLEFA